MILQPLWLRSNDLIDDEDYAFLIAEDRENSIVSSDFTGAQLRWATIEVTRESLEVSSQSATDTPSRVRELALALFRLLPHTPVDSALLEHSRLFELPTDHWERISKAMAPADALEEGLGPSQLESLGRRVPAAAGHLSFLLEPAFVEPYTVFMSVTEFIEFKRSGSEEASARTAADWLVERWDGAREHADKIMEAVIKL